MDSRRSLWHSHIRLKSFFVWCCGSSMRLLQSDYFEPEIGTQRGRRCKPNLFWQLLLVLELPQLLTVIGSNSPHLVQPVHLHRRNDQAGMQLSFSPFIFGVFQCPPPHSPLFLCSPTYCHVALLSMRLIGPGAYYCTAPQGVPLLVHRRVKCTDVKAYRCTAHAMRTHRYKAPVRQAYLCVRCTRVPDISMLQISYLPRIFLFRGFCP